MRSPSDQSGVERRQGRYVLGDLLGRGGMAEVFSGYVIGSHGFQKPVAVKRLLPELANDHVFVDRLIGEAKLLVGMQHGNIVSVLDLARDGNDVFLVMEFVDGPSLRQLLKARGQRRLSIAVSTYIVQSAAAGLEFAHARPGGAVIHADISPSNLLLTTSGEVRVADFGIARREGRMHGVVEGKWAYMAPEQARGEALTPRSDVFALGVVLYELITGQHPFGQRVTADERDSGPIRIAPPRVVDPHVPPGLDAICMRALAEQPRDRYAKMQHLIDALIDERFSNGWREGANDLAQAIREIAPGLSNASGPRTQVTDRPVTLHTQSLISEEHSRLSHPPLLLAVSSDSFDDSLDPTGQAYAAGTTPPPVLVPAANPADPTLEPQLMPTSVSQPPAIPPTPPTAQRPPSSVHIDLGPPPRDSTPTPSTPMAAAEAFRLSAAMLPSPELASVHGATAHSQVMELPRSNKRVWTILTMAALVGVVGAIGWSLKPSSDDEDPAIIQSASPLPDPGNISPQPMLPNTLAPSTPAPVPTTTDPVKPATDQTTQPPTTPATPATPTTGFSRWAQLDPARDQGPSPTPAPATPTNPTAPPATQAVTPPPAQPPPAEPPEATVQHPDLPAGAAVKKEVSKKEASSKKPDKPLPVRMEKPAVGSRGSGSATLRVNTIPGSPWAQVTINGEMQEAPGAKFKLAPGKYFVKLTNSVEHLSYACKVTLAANGITTLRVDLVDRLCERE